jgi:hypothetical protein
LHLGELPAVVHASRVVCSTPTALENAIASGSIHAEDLWGEVTSMSATARRNPVPTVYREGRDFSLAGEAGVGTRLVSAIFRVMEFRRSQYNVLYVRDNPDWQR